MERRKCKQSQSKVNVRETSFLSVSRHCHRRNRGKRGGKSRKLEFALPLLARQPEGLVSWLVPVWEVGSSGKGLPPSEPALAMGSVVGLLKATLSSSRSLTSVAVWEAFTTALLPHFLCPPFHASLHQLMCINCLLVCHCHPH